MVEPGSGDAVGAAIKRRIALDAGFGDDGGPLRILAGRTLEEFMEALRRTCDRRSPFPSRQTQGFLGQERRQGSVGAADILGQPARPAREGTRSEEHTSELQSP